MALEDLELNVGGTQIKGVWIAIVLSFASTIGGGIWAASEFFSRLEALEGSVSDATAETAVVQGRFDDLRAGQSETLQAYQVTIANMQQQLDDNNVGELQGKLAELSTNLSQIMELQRDLLPLRDRVAAVEKSNSETVLTVNAKIEALGNIDDRMTRLQRDINDAWTAMDELANPLGR
jgi:chromosome segregation ATPase